MSGHGSQPAPPIPETIRSGRRPLWQRVLYFVCRGASRWLITLFYRHRVWGRRNVPPDGPLLVISNHQSHLDPIMCGTSMRRPLYYLARAPLFSNRVFGAFLVGLGCVPLRQGETDAAAIRSSIELIKQGKALLVFPEGSRTPDGRVGEFKRGAWVLLSRAKCPVLPMAVEGGYDTWPRRNTLPKLVGGRLATMVGPPIAHADLVAMGPEAGLAFLRERIESMRQQLARRLGSANFALTTSPIPPALRPESDQPAPPPAAGRSRP